MRARVALWACIAPWACVALACSGQPAPQQSAPKPAAEAPANAGTASTGSAGPPATGTAAASDASELGSVVLTNPQGKSTTVRVEIADDDAERTRGLMFRRQLAPDAGMLFLFDHPHQLSFWMRNTYLPLDMIFIRDDMTVLGVVANTEPLTLSPRQVPGASQYVLEVNAGFSQEHGITAGTQVRFSGAAAAASAAP